MRELMTVYVKISEGVLLLKLVYVLAEELEVVLVWIYTLILGLGVVIGVGDDVSGESESDDDEKFNQKLEVKLVPGME